MSRKRHVSIAAGALLLLAAAPFFAHAETDFGQVSMHVANMLERNHYSQRAFDDDISQLLLDNYLEALDYDKKFFTAQDVEGFRMRYGITLDDHLLMSNIQPALNIYQIYDQRVRDRIAKVKKQITESDFIFTADDTIELTRRDSPWPADMEATDDLWRRWIQNQLLREELQKIGEKKEKLEKEAKKAGEAKESEEATAGDSAEVEVDLAQISLTEEERQEIRDDLVERWDRVLSSLDDNDDEEVVNYFLSALAMAYDPHSDYFSHREMENFEISMRHSLTGIGAMLSMVDGMAEIQGLVVGGPAHKSKNLFVKDRIVAVGQGVEGEMVDVVDMTLPKVVELIRGKEDSIVRLKVLREGDSARPDLIAIVRDTVELKDKLANAELIETLDADGNPQRLGWIYLYSFYADMSGGDTSTTADVKRLLQRLTKEGIDGLVLDLRANGGGSLEEAIDLTGLFIPKGPVVQSKDWQGGIESRPSSTRQPIYEGPLIVLTNKASASASEILAAALQDYNRALVVGDDSTFGKGTVQTIMPVRRRMPIWSDKERAGALKVTIQKFYRIAGGSTQLRGVIPDIVLPSRNDALEIGEDALDNPLGYDEIPSERFSLFDSTAFPVEELSHRLNARLADDIEFQYVIEDTARLKQRFDENILSLNKNKRIAETKENEVRAEARDNERRARFNEIREKEDGLFSTFKLTLDNVDETTLTLKSAFSDEENSGMIFAKDDDEDEALEYPHGFDPVKRQTLAILQDLIDIESQGAAQTVNVSGTDTTGETVPAQRVH